MFVQRLYTQGNFPVQWRGLNLIPESLAESILLTGARAGDPHPGHYRWRCFLNLLHVASATNNTGQLLLLYELAQTDEDPALSTSMRLAIVDSSICPAQVLEKARQSDSSILRQKAQARSNMTPWPFGCFTSPPITMSLLHPRLLISATLSMLVLFTACSPGAPQPTRPNQPAGVLLRPGPGASSLPQVIVPVVDFPDATVAEFAQLFGDKIVGNMQWSEPGMRIRVTCSDAVRHKRFRLAHQEKLTALELLTLFAQASQTVVEVNDMATHVRACNE